MNTLKNTLLVALALFSFSCAEAQWGGEKIKGNGDVTTITRSTGDYDALRLAGWMDFELVKGTEGDIKIEGESNLLEYIITEIEYGGLVVKVKKNVNLKPSWNKGIKITIPFEDIEKVSLSGSGDVSSKNVIKSDDFRASLAGSGDIVLDVEANSVEAKISGSGDITLKGGTTNLKASVTGSGDFHGENLDADYTEAKVTGSGDVSVVCNKELKARVTGSGDIEYSGNPDKEDTKVTGSGSISN